MFRSPINFWSTAMMRSPLNSPLIPKERSRSRMTSMRCRLETQRVKRFSLPAAWMPPTRAPTEEPARERIA